MDRIIDFNELKQDRELDKLENYMYDLYYAVAQGKMSMSNFTKEIFDYMKKNNISQEEFLNIQKKLMERYGIDQSFLDEQLKHFGFNQPINNDYESIRKAMGFHEKYKGRIKVATVSKYYIKNDINDIEITLENENVNIKSHKKIDLNDNELNEFLCSYKKTLEEKEVKISLCGDALDYIY